MIVETVQAIKPMKSTKPMILTNFLSFMFCSSFFFLRLHLAAIKTEQAHFFNNTYKMRRKKIIAVF